MHFSYLSVISLRIVFDLPLVLTLCCVYEMFSMLVAVLRVQCIVNGVGLYSVQVDGSLVVWDLHESSSLNESYTDSNGNEFQLRQPTYNTGKV